MSAYTDLVTTHPRRPTPEILTSANPNTKRPMTTARPSAFNRVWSGTGCETLTSTSVFPISSSGPPNGACSAPSVAVEDDDIGGECRGVEENSDIRPAILAADVVFVPTMRPSA